MKKIMFNDKYGLTQAVLEGRKTMTRRIVTNKLYNVVDWKLVEEGDYNAVFDEVEAWTNDVRYFGQYQVGEEVAVAQNYHDVYEALKRTHGSSSRVTREFFHKYVQGGRMPVSNKMFVRADLMPHRIRITNVTVERLQDISDEDCMREGIEKFADGWWTYDKNSRLPFDKVTFRTPREAFAALIDKISGKGTWNRNPFVFVYEFELNNDTARHCGKEQHERTDE